MSKIKLGMISEIQAGPFGTQLHSNEYSNNGVMMLNAKNIGNGIIDSSSVNFVPNDICSKIPQYILKEGDIVFGRAGSIEKHAYVNLQYDGCFQGTNCIRIRCKNKNIAQFISYYLWQPAIVKAISNKASGSTMSYLNTDLLAGLDIKILDENITKTIIKKLNIIAEKLEINNKINAELEKVAKTLYDYWFVQFDFPDENGKPYRTSGGAMVYNETLKREIPSGWEVKKIGYVVSRNQRGITPLYNENKDIPIVNQKCIRNNNIDYKEFYWHDKKKAFDKEAVLQFMDTLVNSMGTGTLGRISPYIIKDFALPHSCVTLLRFKPNITTPCWLYRAIKSMETIITKIGIGSTGQTSLDNIDLEKLLICLPPYELLESFDLKVIDFYKTITSNNEQIKYLSQLRDFLLPLLMNGQVQVQSSPKMEVASTAVKDKTYYNQRFELWLSNQGLAARGNINKETLRGLFDAMDDNDK